MPNKHPSVAPPGALEEAEARISVVAISPSSGEPEYVLYDHLRDCAVRDERGETLKFPDVAAANAAFGTVLSGRSLYAQYIREDLAAIGRIGMNPAHVEAWMRLEHGTLDALDPATFRREVEVAAQCVDASTLDENDRLAETYGLVSPPLSPPPCTQCGAPLSRDLPPDDRDYRCAVCEGADVSDSAERGA